MKILPAVREKYMFFCPVSTYKCQDFAEMDYKIERAVTLGAPIDNEFREIHILYYQNVFVFDAKENTVIDMYKHKTRIYNVSEEEKAAYDKVNQKILV